ncbi:hypothetical protein AS888_23345 [Peribacillus simplex]|uniref:Uncharacterized protein n=1 Tax=Peribacillus simplex TaxID=1478 RepID=A0A120GP11_9BACI|nr:hypothetical protein AS888_23345 [Peribacillus simplex]
MIHSPKTMKTLENHNQHDWNGVQDSCFLNEILGNPAEKAPRADRHLISECSKWKETGNSRTRKTADDL